MLVTPQRSSDWRVDVEKLTKWIHARWAGVVYSASASPQRTHLWAWPDGGELWVPADLECAWVQSDSVRLAAIAAWLQASGSEDLILTDEGYVDTVELAGLAESDLLTQLLAK